MRKRRRDDDGGGLIGAPRIRLALVVTATAVLARGRRVVLGAHGAASISVRLLAVALVPALLVARGAAGDSTRHLTNRELGLQRAMLTKAQHQVDQWKAWLRSPRAVAQRHASRTAHEHESSRRARATDEKGFPGAINGPGFKSLDLAKGEKVQRRLGSHAALVDTPRGRHFLAESLLPLDGKTPKGSTAP